MDFSVLVVFRLSFLGVSILWGMLRYFALNMSLDGEANPLPSSSFVIAVERLELCESLRNGLFHDLSLVGNGLVVCRDWEEAALLVTLGKARS